MKSMTKLFAIALMLALVAAGCAAAQSKDSTPMLIDKLPTNLWNPQTLLGADQHKKDQLAMVGEIEKLWQGKYRITAQHIYLLPPDHDSLPNPVISKMDFHNAMNDLDPEPELVFSNETFELPYLNIWKTSGPHPKYVAFSLYPIADKNTLLGYFELEKE
jgi:hypothetical protein